jgi:hypothetical protein
MHRPFCVVGALATLCAAGSAVAAPVFISPGASPYLSQADSPFQPMLGTAEYFWLEDFEDGLVNTPGLSASEGIVYSGNPITDSVDGDDGVLDGSGLDGHSFFYPFNENPHLRFEFDSEVLGVLPNHAGLVFTDGCLNQLVTFRAWDANGDEIGAISTTLGDADLRGTAADDRFFGIVHEGGISAIEISLSPFGGMEVDHVQYMYAPLPAPPALALLAGIVAAGSSRRRRS